MTMILVFIAGVIVGALLGAWIAIAAASEGIARGIKSIGLPKEMKARFIEGMKKKATHV